MRNLTDEVQAKNFLWLAVIVTVSFLIKNPFLNQPFLGHFGSYQAIVAMIAIEFVKQDFQNFLYPNSFLLVNGLPALEIIYYPLSSLIAAVFWKFFGGSLDYWGRMQAMLFTAFSVIFTYFSAKKICPVKKYALWVAFFIAFSPMCLIYGRSFMNEASAFFLLMASFLFLQIWSKKNKLPYLIASGFFFSLVLILRLHFVSALLAFFLVIWQNQGTRRITIKSLITFSISVVLPAVFWFGHTYHVAETASNVHTSLFVQLEKRPFPDPLLWSSAFYMRVFLRETLFRLLGPLTLLLTIGSLFRLFVRENLWILAWFAGTGLLILLMPSKFYDHPFYLMPLIFPSALLAALTMFEIEKKVTNNIVKFCFILLILISNVVIYWRPAFSLPSDQEILFEAVREIRNLTEESDRILALHGTSADFLYYLGRNGHSFQIGHDRHEDTYINLKNTGNLSEEERRKRFEASKTSVAWLEYMKQVNGIQYFAAVPISDLDKEPAFRDYLKQNYDLLTKPDDPFVLYCVSDN